MTYHFNQHLIHIIDMQFEPLRNIYSGLLPIGAKIHFQKALPGRNSKHGKSLRRQTQRQGIRRGTAKFEDVDYHFKF